MVKRFLLPPSTRAKQTNKQTHNEDNSQQCSDIHAPLPSPRRPPRCVFVEEANRFPRKQIVYSRLF